MVERPGEKRRNEQIQSNVALARSILRLEPNLISRNDLKKSIDLFPVLKMVFLFKFKKYTLHRPHTVRNNVGFEKFY